MHKIRRKFGKVFMHLWHGVYLHAHFKWNTKQRPGESTGEVKQPPRRSAQSLFGPCLSMACETQRTRALPSAPTPRRLALASSSHRLLVPGVFSQLLTWKPQEASLGAWKARRAEDRARPIPTLWGIRETLGMGHVGGFCWSDTQIWVSTGILFSTEDRFPSRKGSL